VTAKKVRYLLWEMGLGEVMEYISTHSTVAARERRLTNLYEMAAHGEIFELRKEKAIPLRREHRPMLITELDKPGIWK
jgi:hypothetical protein